MIWRWRRTDARTLPYRRLLYLGIYSVVNLKLENVFNWQKSDNRHLFWHSMPLSRWLVETMSTNILLFYVLFPVNVFTYKGAFLNCNHEINKSNSAVPMMQDFYAITTNLLWYNKLFKLTVCSSCFAIGIFNCNLIIWRI